MTVLVGCVGQLFQGDLDVGRRVAERLLAAPLEPGVVIEDLHYGAIAVAQLLEDVVPDALVLVGAAGRGRPPGTVTRRPVEPPAVADQRAVAEAATGYVSIDLVVEVAAALGVLPRHSVSIEVEPATTAVSDVLSPAAEAALPQLVQRARGEARRLPVLVMADRLRAVGAGHDPGGLPPAAVSLLAALDGVARTGEWGPTFALADRLRRALSSDGAEGMDRLEWALTWGVLEELARLERAEAQELSTDRTW